MSEFVDRAKKMLKLVKKDHLSTLIEAILLSNEELRKFDFKFSVRVEDDGNIRLTPNDKVKEWLDA